MLIADQNWILKGKIVEENRYIYLTKYEYTQATYIIVHALIKRPPEYQNKVSEQKGKYGQIYHHVVIS